jgi:hypothetical protein
MRRVVLLGRISLYGSGASRLHDDIIAVTARWIDPVARKAPLTPYAEGTDKDAMRALEKAFEAARGRRVPQGVESKLQSVAPQDVAELLPHLQQRAATVADAAKALLAARGKQEADAMRAILADQRKRILAMQDQLQIPLLEEERRQQEDERKSWVKRLIAIDREVIEEPARILRSYEVQAPRVEPIGLVYLWPVSG